MGLVLDALLRQAARGVRDSKDRLDLFHVDVLALDVFVGEKVA